MPRRVKCDYCHGEAKLVSGREIYPHRPDLVAKQFWRCEPCDAYVGCHRRHPKDNRDGTKPLGRLANAELRREKQRAHAAFDPIWKSGQMRRKAAYAWLAEQLGISRANCHIGMMDVDACRAVVAAVTNRQARPA